METKLYALQHHEMRLKTSHDLGHLKTYHARRGVVGTAVFYVIENGSWIEINSKTGEKNED